MSVKTVPLLKDAIALAQTGKMAEAATLLRGVVSGTVEAEPAEGEAFDLLVETYLFLMGGDLRKEGRDFGYSSLEEITSALDQLSRMGPL
mgnify:CR=1 FL=1